MAERSNSEKLLWVAAGIGGGLAAYSLWQKAAERSLKGEVVLITGGSRGLGLQLARQLLQEGCHVAICARDEQELAEARQQLSDTGRSVLAVPCDVTDREQVDRLISHVTNHFGKIDILINNAGNIQVGPIENQRLEDFKSAMDLIFFGSVHTILAVLPQMLNRRAGSIVNITSFGGKVVVPHLVPYCCAKFAATALAEGIRVETAKDNIHVLTVAPGTLRTGSYVNAEYRGQVEKEAAWFSEGEMSKLMSVETEAAARRVIYAIKRRESEIVIGLAAQIMARAHGALPEASSAIMSWVNEYFLPGPAREPESAKGIELEQQGRGETIQKVSKENQEEAEQFHQPNR